MEKVVPLPNVSHEVRVDRARKLVELKISGVVPPEDAAWMAEEFRAAIRSLGDDVGDHLSLYDFSAVPVVPLATVEQLRASLVNPEVRKLWARKLAIVTSTALGRMQAQRVREVRPDIGLFDTREEALAWLLS
ncbi:hypothetical protein [Sphingomonas sp. G-3-2-10]|uniref:hypothetical protein n=1 Tax=Sphingomonas sp. G-3-2-10 TaxID=2728838 RepID=UPI00146EB5AE|nr:hypothetical protein [Sphingomonas sp. G-3-2-10]NML06931.1 hypothetical protein [Sphingomonas sp. G-3-2-10]